MVSTGAVSLAGFYVVAGGVWVEGIVPVGGMGGVARVGGVGGVVCVVVIRGKEVNTKSITLHSGRWRFILLVDHEPVGTNCAPSSSVCGPLSNVGVGNTSAVCIGGLIPQTLGRNFS